MSAEKKGKRVLLSWLRLQAGLRFTNLDERFKSRNIAVKESSVLPVQMFHGVDDVNLAKYRARIRNLPRCCLTALMLWARLCIFSNLFKV